MPMMLISRFMGESSKITIAWSMGDVDEDAMTPDIDTTKIDVVISDLVDSDGMGWTDSDGDEMTDDPFVKSITFGSRTSTQLVSFTTEADADDNQVPTNILAAEIAGVGAGLNVAGFDANYNGETSLENFIKLVYDDDDNSEVFADGAINGQFLGVSAADSGNADQPRAIIGTWNIGADRMVATTSTTGTTTMTILEDRDPNQPGSTLDGVYGVDLVVP